MFSCPVAVIYLRPATGEDQVILEPACVEATGPGIRVAAPGLEGEIDGSVYTFGSSNATALATRTIDQIYEALSRLTNDADEFGFPEAQYHPVLAKALLVHAARWGEVGAALRNQLGLSAQRRRRDLTQMLGYGPVDIERVSGAARNRPMLIGAASIGKDKRQTFRFPLPPALGDGRVAATHRDAGLAFTSEHAITEAPHGSPRRASSTCGSGCRAD